jgi:LuxR family transcriptional regulator, maltose regulon positive regulatory protein
MGGGRPSSDESRTAVLADQPVIIPAWLRPPQPLPALALRRGLLEQLAGSDARVVVVVAPGGYGKTIALQQWTGSAGVPVAWVQADAADDDPLVFLQYLVAALRQVTDLRAEVGDWLLQAPPPLETRVLPALAEAVAGAGPFVLVVDDIHLLTSATSWRILGMLMDRLPRGARMCLVGRAAPELPLQPLREAGRLLELGPADLALSPDETRELLVLCGVPADEDAVTRLEEITEGWAAGVSLAALAEKGSPGGDVLTGVHGGREDIARYLAHEVLGRLPRAVAGFLLQTSILERLSPELCRVVTRDPRAGERLREVARHNLFVSSLDDHGEWFRYHHLFAEFLQAELAQRGEDDAAALHLRAAAWFEQHGMLEEALHHLLAGGEPKRAADIVSRAHLHYGQLARYETLYRWLTLFTDEQILADPALVVAAGWIAPMAGDTSRGRRWMQAALTTDVGDAVWPGTSVPVRAIQAGLVAVFAPLGVRQMVENAELAVRLSETAPLSERSAMACSLGIALWLDGRDSREAVRSLEEAEDMGTVANVLAFVHALGYQAHILADEGRWEEARACVDRGLARVESAGLVWGPPDFPLLAADVRVLAHEGDPGLAERLELLADVLERSVVGPAATLLAAGVAGHVLLERGDLEGAERWLRAGEACLEQWPDAGILGARLRRLRERADGRRPGAH